jgi:phosphoglycerol transferase MdoB-like AlkP superfamily enzyme
MGMENLNFDSELMKAYDIMTGSEQFFSFIITYSGHGAYVGSDVSAQYYDYAAALLPEDTNEMVIHAYAHAYATDLFIGQLYEALEQDGLLDDTVLVFYADHYDYYVLDNQLVMEQKGAQDTNFLTNTPFFIYEKNTPAQKIDKVTSSIDILPTLVNLFGLDDDGTHYVGNDIFSDNGGYVIFADYSWYDGETYWNSVSGETPTEEIATRNEEIRTRLNMSWDTMKLDYFAYGKE